MDYVEIDGVLLRTLRSAGMTARTAAIHAHGILHHDARSVRRVARETSGEPTFRDDIAMSPVRLAHGIHWCGGQLRLVEAHAHLPETALDAAVGRRLQAIISHPLLSGEENVVRTTHEDDERFRIETRWPAKNDVAVTIIHTDVAPLRLRYGVVERLLAPIVRTCADMRHTKGLRSWREMTKTLGTMVAQVGLTSSALQSMAGMNLMDAALWAALSTLLLWTAVLLFNTEQSRDDRMPHLNFRADLEARQIEEGMRD